MSMPSIYVTKISPLYRINFLFNYRTKLSLSETSVVSNAPYNVNQLN